MSEWRPDDRGDALALLELAGEDEVTEARRAVRLIAERGYGAEAALEERLDELIALAHRG